MRTTAVLASIVLLCSLTGCGGSGRKAPDKSSLPDLPKCDDIWVVGQKLPKDYLGCINRSNEVVKRDFMNCGLDTDKQSGGTALLFWYEDGVSTFYAFGNDTLNRDFDWEIDDGSEPATNPAYAGTDTTALDIAKNVCTGD
jgi:hypothetical protein